MDLVLQKEESSSEQILLPQLDNRRDNSKHEGIRHGHHKTNSRVQRGFAAGHKSSKSSRDLAQDFANSIAPYPEKSSFDWKLALMSESEFDWQMFLLTGQVRVLSFSIAKAANTKEVFADARMLCIECIASKEKTTEKETPASAAFGKTKSIKTRFSFGHEERTSGKAAKVNVAAKEKIGNQVILTVYNADEVVLLQIKLADVEALPEEAKESSSKSMVLQTSGDEAGVFNIEFETTQTRDKVNKLLKCIAAKLLPQTHYGIHGLGSFPSNFNYIVDQSLVCVHQGEVFVHPVESAEGGLLVGTKIKFDESPVGVLLFYGRMLLFSSGIILAEPYMSIDLLSISKVAALAESNSVESSVFSSVDHKNGFQIVLPSPNTKNITLAFLAPTEWEIGKWIKAIQECIQTESGKTLLLRKDETKDEKPIETFNDSLLHTQVFFRFFRDVFYDFEILSATQVPNPLEWTETLGVLSKNKKNILLRYAENDLIEYQNLVDRMFLFSKSCILVCDDGPSSSTDESIGFSFPGFNPEVFSLGSIAVLKVWRLFKRSGAHNAVSSSSFDSTLSTVSIARELMQTLPDVQQLYDFGRSDEAHEILGKAAKEQLQLLILAEYVKDNKSDLFSGKKLIFSWDEAIENKPRTCSTKGLFSASSGEIYILNPPLQVFQDFLKGKDDHLGLKTVTMWTQLNWLDAILLAVHERRRILSKAMAHLTEWFETNGSGLNTKHYSSHSNFQMRMKGETTKLDRLIAELPTHEQIMEHYSTFLAHV